MSEPRFSLQLCSSMSSRALDQMAGGGQKFLYDASGVGKELGKNK